MPDLLRLDPPPRIDDLAIWTRNGEWHRIKPADYMAKLSVLEANLPYVEREVPMLLSSSVVTAGGHPNFPDENAANNIRLWFTVPNTWDGTTDITITSRWQSAGTGLADLETFIGYSTAVDESAITTVQAFTNTNLTWTGANTYKTLTTTVTAANMAANRLFLVAFRRNTGDANTSNVFMEGAYARTKYR